MKYYRTINQKQIEAGIEFYKILFENEYKRKSTGKDLQHKEEASKKNN